MWRVRRAGPRAAAEARLLGALLGLLLAASADGASAIDLQGHRGARGLAPENTLAAFRVALGIGVTTLETDLALTADDVLVLAHDPELNPALVRGPQGHWIGEAGPAIRTLTARELQGYDVGRLNPNHAYAAAWSSQRPSDGERMPTLAQLFALARDARTPGGAPVRFNIETKLTPSGPARTASPEEFARALAGAIRAADMTERVTVQSFDWRALLALKRLAPGVRTACLTIESNGMNTVREDATGASPWHAGLKRADHGGSLLRTVSAAGCAIWSPFWRNLTVELVAEARALGLAVIPWTVNEPADIDCMLDLAVDGLISDYPDRARAVLARRNVRVD